ncbi:MAG: haloacid dehalogenase-like hydrolase [Acidobacteriota bacterium]
MINSVWERYENLIPSLFLDPLRSLESDLENDPEHIDKTAIFDLDNTLLIGDIGDALFARLKNLEKKNSLKTDGSKIAFTWKQYRDLIEKGNKIEAYKNVVTCMEGISISIIENLTKEIMNSDFRYIEHEKEKIPVPAINEIMKKFMELLKSLDYKVYIISASNIYSVRFIAGYFFRIPAEQAFGIETELTLNSNKEYILSGRLKEPVPVGSGKVDLYRLKEGNHSPLIAAGDSIPDIPMMELVDKKGFNIWVGNDEQVFKKIKGSVKNPKNFYYFNRNRDYFRRNT